MLQKHLTSDRLAPEVSLDSIAKKTEGYSGADIRLLCKEAAMKPMRRLMEKLELMEAENLVSNNSRKNNGRNMRHQYKTNNNAVSDEEIQVNMKKKQSYH